MTKAENVNYIKYTVVLIGVAYMVTIPRYSGFVMVAVLGVIIVSCSGVFPEKRSFVILALSCIAGLVVLAVLNIIKDYIIKYIRKGSWQKQINKISLTLRRI